MYSVISEINKLRDGKKLNIDYQNSNRYRVVAVEENGIKTSYCFGVPIYNKETGKLIDLRFQKDNDTLWMQGSDMKALLKDDIVLVNREGSVTLHAENIIPGENCDVLPTTNGIALRVPYTRGKAHTMTMTVEPPFLSVRGNNKCFSLMKEEFRPFVTVSCIGTLDAKGKISAPCSITYQRTDDKTFTFTVDPQGSEAESVFYELNLYEPKLFRDTTVESMYPTENNAFGSVAFLGSTNAYGEQWLYSAIDISKISELLDRRLLRALWHVPQYTDNNITLSAFGVSSRFCSFGSTWQNKIQETERITGSVIQKGYQTLDITSIITDRDTPYLTQSEGLILRARREDRGFLTVATGDSCLMPQILEISFR